MWWAFIYWAHVKLRSEIAHRIWRRWAPWNGMAVLEQGMLCCVWCGVPITLHMELHTWDDNWDCKYFYDFCHCGYLEVPTFV